MVVNYSEEKKKCRMHEVRNNDGTMRDYRLS